MSQADVDVNNVGWVSDSVTQQIQEQGAKYGVDGKMSGYAMPTQPTMLTEIWAEVKFSDVIFSVTNGIGGKQSKDGVGIPVTRIETIADQTINFEKVGFIADYDDSKIDKYLLNQGDILFSHINSPLHLGKTAIYREKKHLYHGINLLRIVTTANVMVPDFFNYYCKLLRSQSEFSMRAQHAVNQSSLNQKKLGEFDIPLPPLAEQQQIAAKLDDLLSQVDSLKTRLDSIPKNLKRFRQSVLAAAVSGRLTEEWRKKQSLGLWKKIKLEDVANILDPHPSHRTPQEVKGGIPYIGIGDLKDDGLIDFDNVRKVSTDILAEHQNRYQLKQGDFVFGKIGTLGKATMLPLGVNYTLSANVILIQPRLNMSSPMYLMFFLSSPKSMMEVAKQANSTSQAAFGIKKMRAFQCEIPSVAEQTEIVNRVEQLFTYADQIEQRVKDAQARVNHLTQAILAKAFRGELTAEWREQNPDLISGENSAEALLAKIKAEREKIKSKNSK